MLATGGGGSVVLKRLMPFLDSGEPGTMLFSLINAGRTCRYFTHMAEELQVDAHVGEAVHQTFITAAMWAVAKMIPELLNVLCMHGARRSAETGRLNRSTAAVSFHRSTL